MSVASPGDSILLSVPKQLLALVAVFVTLSIPQFDCVFTKWTLGVMFITYLSPILYLIPMDFPFEYVHFIMLILSLVLKCLSVFRQPFSCGLASIIMTWMSLVDAWCICAVLVGTMGFRVLFDRLFGEPKRTSCQRIVDVSSSSIWKNTDVQ